MSRRRRTGSDRPARLPWDDLYPTLDLHGHTADEATRVAERWLLARQADRETTVRIITGWGRHSIGPPVLPTTIEDLLTRLRGSLVQTFTREARGGAFVIRLKRPSATRTGKSSGPPSLDPRLVREAEDSLAELGVAPTSELVAAEVRRILDERRREAK
jgi:hypothetical protein